MAEPALLQPTDSAETIDDPVVDCDGLVKIYASPSGRVQALRGVDLTVERGDLVALAGPSGSGKSSLLRIVAGLDVASAGTARVAGVDFANVRPGRRRRVRARLLSHVYQRPGDNLLDDLTAIEQVRRVAHRRHAPPSAANDALERVGLEHRHAHRSHELSGGEQQRLAFARAIAGNPAVVIADEPTAELDAATTNVILDVIDDLHRAGTTIIVATHDPTALERIDHVITLHTGVVASIRRHGRLRHVIDQTGRLQLPDHLRARFPARTAELDWDDTRHHVTVRP